MDDVFKGILVVFLIVFIIFIYSLRSDPPHEVSFHKGDSVYVLPDSTKAIISSVIYQTQKQRVEGKTKKQRIVIGTITRIVYTDKNGVIHSQSISDEVLRKIK